MVSPIGGSGFDISALQSRIQQQAQGQFQQKFSDADSDSSGGLSIEEFEAAGADQLQSSGKTVEEAFSSLDADGDGNLTQQELGQGIQEKLRATIQQQIQSQFSSDNFLQLLQAQEASLGGQTSGGVSNDLQNNLIDALFGEEDAA